MRCFVQVWTKNKGLCAPISISSEGRIVFPAHYLKKKKNKTKKDNATLECVLFIVGKHGEIWEVCWDLWL